MVEENMRTATLHNIEQARQKHAPATRPGPQKRESGERLESTRSVMGISYAADDMMKNPPKDVVELCVRFAPEADKIRQLGRLGFTAAVEQGRILLSVKRKIAFGYFRLWLAYEFRDWSERHAQQLMNLARLVKSESDSDLERLQKQIDLSAAYMLAAPSMPPEVLEAIIQLAEQGQRIDKRKVREIKAALVPPVTKESGAPAAHTTGRRRRTASQKPPPQDASPPPQDAAPPSPQHEQREAREAEEAWTDRLARWESEARALFPENGSTLSPEGRATVAGKLGDIITWLQTVQALLLQSPEAQS
jgi:hypothetical protein